MGLSVSRGLGEGKERPRAGAAEEGLASGLHRGEQGDSFCLCQERGG